MSVAHGLRVCLAWLGSAWRGTAWHGKAWLGSAWRGTARQGTARQGKARAVQQRATRLRVGEGLRYREPSSARPMVHSLLDTSHVLLLARLYAHDRGHSLSTISLRIANQGSLFSRLSRGESDLTISRRDRIIQKFSDNWPEGLIWPEDIPRPEPSRGEGEAA